MSIKVFSPIQSTEKDKWFNLPVANTVYKFPISILPSKGIVDFKVYEKSDTAVSIAFITFIDSANVAISSHSTINPNTPSANGYSSITLEIPTGSAYFLMGSDNACHVLAKAGKLEPFPPLTPTKYSSSQSITITNTANVALLGGGGAAGSTGSANTVSNTSRGGGGSGYLTHASVSPGNYSLTIGAGGQTVLGSNTAAGGTGGTTSFAGSNAAGGVGTGSSTGGAGGSGGGSSGTTSTVNNNGGFNGSSSGGAGSGVTTNLFTGAAAGGPWPNGAGGSYAGGAGGNSSTPLTQNGASALPNTGGGGGGIKSNATEGYAATGGNGGSGALWVLES